MLTRLLVPSAWIAFAFTASMAAGAQAAPAVDARSDHARRAYLRLTDFDWYNYVKVEAVQRRSVGSAGVTGEVAQVRVHGLADFCGDPEDEDDDPRWGQVLDTVDSSGVVVRVIEPYAQAQGPVTADHEVRSCETGELLSVSETTFHIDVVWTPFVNPDVSDRPPDYAIDVPCVAVVAQTRTSRSLDAMARYAVEGLPPAFQELVDDPVFEIAELGSWEDTRAAVKSGTCGS